MPGTWLLVAAAAAVLLGAAHSVLGERYILGRMFRRPLPPLFGDDRFTRRTVRLAWHVTSVAWWGFAAVLLLAAGTTGDLARGPVLATVAGTFAVSGVLAAGFTRGRHLSWVLFGIVAVGAWLGI